MGLTPGFAEVEVFWPSSGGYSRSVKAEARSSSRFWPRAGPYRHALPGRSDAKGLRWERAQQRGQRSLSCSYSACVVTACPVSVTAWPRALLGPSPLLSALDAREASGRTSTLLRRHTRWWRTSCPLLNACTHAPAAPGPGTICGYAMGLPGLRRGMDACQGRCWCSHPDPVAVPRLGLPVPSFPSNMMGIKFYFSFLSSILLNHFMLHLGICTSVVLSKTTDWKTPSVSESW